MDTKLQYPEMHIIEHDGDIDNHLRIISKVGVTITAVGLIPEETGRLVTYDRLANGNKVHIPANLPQASLREEDTEQKKIREETENIVADRWALPESIDEFEIIGNEFIFGFDNLHTPVQRLYVPVLYYGHTSDDSLALPADINHDNEIVSRTPHDILKIIEDRDHTDGIRGQRNRSVTRFMVHAYLQHVCS